MSPGRIKNIAQLTIGFLLVLVRSMSTGCPAGWTGPSCKFKCRCTGDNCDESGVCYGGAKCIAPYFGTACQYMDLVQFGVRPPGPIFDGNDTTCTDTSYTETILFDKEQHFTFLRMIFQSWPTTLTKGDMTEVFISYTNIKHNITRRCMHQSFFFVSNEVLDVHCEIGELITQVNVLWMSNVSLCSIYISGGRNLAIMSSVTSTSINHPWRAGNAVDGVEPYLTSCFKSGYDDTEASWTLSFTSKIKINRVILSGCSDCQMLFKTNTASFRFYPGNAEHLKTNSSLEWPITLSGVPEMIQIQPSVKGSNLTICELITLGDCLPGYNGLQCERQCAQKCAMTSCGLLNDACATCRKHTFGTTCNRNCSYCGGNGMCNPFNGSCIEGCRDPNQTICEHEVTTHQTTESLDKAMVAGQERVRVWMVYLVLAGTLVTTLTVCLLFLGLTKRDSIMNLMNVGEGPNIHLRRLSRIRSESVA